jgi:hypothetical protein
VEPYRLTSNWFRIPPTCSTPTPSRPSTAWRTGNSRCCVRAALAGYLLRRWNVDCTENHSLRGSEFHLWLRNRQALYGVTNLVLAPGYEQSEKA